MGLQEGLRLTVGLFYRPRALELHLCQTFLRLVAVFLLSPSTTVLWRVRAAWEIKPEDLSQGKRRGILATALRKL